MEGSTFLGKEVVPTQMFCQPFDMHTAVLRNEHCYTHTDRFYGEEFPARIAVMERLGVEQVYVHIPAQAAHGEFSGKGMCPQ